MDWLHLSSDIESLVVVCFDREGRLSWCNAGFRRLQAEGTDAALQQFSAPQLAPWLQASGSETTCLHEGLLTLNGSGDRMISLRGKVIASPAGLWVVAGYDIAEIEGASATLLDLNSALQQTQRELGRANRLLRQREAEIEALSRTDSLTGVNNRRGLEEALASESARRSRHGGPASLVILDIDHFKHVNDNHGHAVGDMVLKGLGALLSSLARETDCVARFGGEEFVILLSLAQLGEAVALAHRVRQAVETLELPGAPRFTVSLGVTQWQAQEDASAALARADAALYRAKREGRNRVERGLIEEVRAPTTP